MGAYSYLKSQGLYPQVRAFANSAPGMYTPSASQAPMLSGGDYPSAPNIGRMSQSAPQMPSYSMSGFSNSPAATSAPFAGMGYQQQLSMANRGQIARGPSPGFVATDAARTAQGPFGAPSMASQLPQFGETGRDVQNYRDTRTLTMQANERANQYGMAQTDFMGSGADLNRANAGTIPGMAQAEEGLIGAQAEQARQMPQDYKTREASYQKQLAQRDQDLRALQARHDALAEKLATVQQPIHGQPARAPQLTQGETDFIHDMTSGDKPRMSQDEAMQAIMKMRGQGGQQPGFTPNSTADMRSVGGAANTPVQEDDGRDRASPQGAAAPDPATTQRLTEALNPNRPAVSSFNGKQLDAYTAQQYLNKAGGDKEKARQMAKQEGYQF